MTSFSIDEYENILQVADLLVTGVPEPFRREKVLFLTFDSREVKKGTLFICKGAGFREKFLRDAVDLGAVAYVSEKSYDVPVPGIIVSDIRKAMAVLADKFSGSAWKNLNIIAFGGTKGKSTSTCFMKSVVDEYMKVTGGKPSGLLSTICYYDGGKVEEARLTTPEAVELHRHMARAVENGITWMEMEVSSQALKYHRVDGLRFNVGVFLNISRDHISSVEHKDFGDYFESKMKMFPMTDHAVVNLDSGFSNMALEAAASAGDVTTFSIEDPGADYYGYDIENWGEGYSFKVKGKNISGRFAIGMLGLFNVENAMAVIAAAGVCGIPEDCVRKGLIQARAAGRMEIFTTADSRIVAVVDYAHNGLSFRKLFETVEKEGQDRSIYTVFGCPGGKALERRADLGRIAGKYSSEVFLVPEDPGKESADDISREISRYVSEEDCPYEIIGDRGSGIEKAIRQAEKSGMPAVVLVTGKGRETRQKIGQEYVDCPSDVDHVEKQIREYDMRHPAGM